MEKSNQKPKLQFDNDKYGEIDKDITSALAYRSNADSELCLTHGYYCETDEGVWYELYVHEECDSRVDEDFLDNNIGWFDGFHGLWLGDFKEHSQVTFFVPNGEEKFTYDAMLRNLL